MKALEFGALHCLLILCVGILPVAGTAAGDNLHHQEGGCIDCEIVPISGSGNCGGEPCAATTSSCSSHHGLSMIAVAISSQVPAIIGAAGAARGNDYLKPSPPSRIDRPPIT